MSVLLKIPVLTRATAQLAKVRGQWNKGAKRSEGGLPELQAGSPLGPKFGNRATCPLWRVSGLKGGPEIKFGQEQKFILRWQVQTGHGPELWHL